jgi:hypothetical protein
MALASLANNKDALKKLRKEIEDSFPSKELLLAASLEELEQLDYRELASTNTTLCAEGRIIA